MSRNYLCLECPQLAEPNSRRCTNHYKPPRKPPWNNNAYRSNRRKTSGSKYQQNQSWQERQYKKKTVENYIKQYGNLCPGYERVPHNATDNNPLTADHIVPKHAGGNPFGPLRVLCRSCNSRRGQKTAKKYNEKSFY